MVAHSRTSLAVWDLGYISSADCKLIASEVEPGGSFPACLVHATPDCLSLVIFLLYRYQRCSVYEIYPQSETPQFTKITGLDLEYDIGFVTVSFDKMIWVVLHWQEVIFRVWDYRLNASVSFVALDGGESKCDRSSEVIATQTAIVMLHEKEILIWAIPPLSPQPPDFKDYNLPHFPPVIKIKFPDDPPLRSPPCSTLAEWRIMSNWYLDPLKPLYFDKVYSRDFKVQRFKIIIKPDLSDATLHCINTLRLNTSEFSGEIPFQSIFCEDSLVYSWSVSNLGTCTGSTLECIGSPLLHLPSHHPSTGIIQVPLPQDRPYGAVGICSVSGRVVTGDGYQNLSSL